MKIPLTPGEIVACLTIAGMVGGFLQSFIKWLIDRYVTPNKKQDEMQDKRLCIIESAMKALLHDRLFAELQEHLNNGYITIDAYKNLEYMYKSYENLGGNGTGRHMWESIKKLPLKGCE